MGYIDTFETLRAKLKYGVSVRDQICNLPFLIYWKWTYFIVFGCNIKNDGKNNLHSAHINDPLRWGKGNEWKKKLKLKLK